MANSQQIPGSKLNFSKTLSAIVFFHDNNISPPSSSLTPAEARLSNIIFTPGLVNKAIKHLRSKSKGGPDSIPPEFYKKCSLWLSEPLAYLFQASFDAGFLPPIWSIAYITPIYKKGDRTDPANYRPIALTCVMCKLMEAVIKEQLLSYLLQHSLISKHQHAFIRKHSTASNLLECVNDWTIALNCKQYVDVIYIDYARVFDSVVHSKLMLKLRQFGIHDKLLAWLQMFINNRTQCVIIENCFSAFRPVISGVIGLQGSFLGPILFYFS
jgi:Reverse transcriptase (RNA-dependent DNA polymerase)